MQRWLLQYQNFPVYLNFSIFRAMSIHSHSSFNKDLFLSLMKNEFEAFPEHSLCLFFQTRHICDWPVGLVA